MSDTYEISGSNGLPRRTLVKGAAWSVPILAAAVAVPGTSATGPVVTCPAITWADWNGWVNQGQPLVSNGGANGQNGWNRSLRGVTGFVSMLDNQAVAPSSNDPKAYVITDVEIPVQAGVTYTFAFDAVGGWGNSENNTNTRWQSVDVNINGTTMWSGSTLSNLLPSLDVQHFSFTYVAPPGVTSIMLTYRFAIPPRPRADALGANDDIAITNPTITCS